MPESFRGLRKLSCAPILSWRIDKKIRSHHEAHEGHEGFVYFILLNFVLFVTFVVKCLFLLWLRHSRARLFVVINFLTTKHTKEEGQKAYPTDRRLLPRQAVAYDFKRLFIVCRFSQLEHLFPNGTRLGFFAGLIERRGELECRAVVVGIADQ